MTAAIIPFPVKGTNSEEWQREHSIALYRADIERYRMAIAIDTDLLKTCESRLAKLLAKDAKRGPLAEKSQDAMAAAIVQHADDAGGLLLEVNTPGWGAGVEYSATLIEIRLALHEYRERHGADHWKLYLLEGGRA